MVTKFQELICWQKAFDLTDCVYDATENMKDYGLKDQLRRSAVLCMNNIAEGFGKVSGNDMRRFFGYTTASCLEIESMTYLLERRSILDKKIVYNMRELAIETYKVTAGFAKSIKKQNSNLFTKYILSLFF